MRVKYSFCNEEVEIEVSEEWGILLMDLDRQEHNNNQKELRRHCSLEALNLDDAYLPSEVNLEADYLKNEEYEALHSAIRKLSLRQQWLIEQVFFEGRKYTDIAAQEGKIESAIRNTTDRALKNLKKFLE